MLPLTTKKGAPNKTLAIQHDVVAQRDNDPLLNIPALRRYTYMLLLLFVFVFIPFKRRVKNQKSKVKN